MTAQLEVLYEILNREEIRGEAVKIIRLLVARIIVTPKNGGLEIHPISDLAGIRRLASEDWDTR